MGFWKNLRELIMGSGGEGDPGLYYYIRLYNTPHQPTPTDEIVRVRIHPNNDLSLADDGTYFVRKHITGTRHFKRGELILYFSPQRTLQDHEVTGGELVDEATYNEYLASHES